MAWSMSIGRVVIAEGDLESLELSNVEVDSSSKYGVERGRYRTLDTQSAAEDASRR